MQKKRQSEDHMHNQNMGHNEDDEDDDGEEPMDEDDLKMYE